MTTIRILVFLNSLVRNRRLILTLAANELRKRYVGTIGGMLWAVAQPFALIVTYWFVFTHGLKVGLISDIPFILYFVCGFAPWLMFSETVSLSAGVIVGNQHLVKKMVFPTEILPVVSQVVTLILHVVALAIVGAILFYQRWPVGWHALQLPYYALCAVAFSLGLSWLIAALNVFYRDVAQIVSVVLGIWFWLTPIVWPLEMLSPMLQRIIGLNPMYYVVQGYRDSLLGGAPFWDKLGPALEFWAICLAVLFIGASVFRRLKPEFAEVL
jgi:lipopolysaccharide transport system permease protein/teichoic acid transport system permease protein